MNEIKIETGYDPIKILTRNGSNDDTSVIKEIFEENVYHLHDNFFVEDGVVLDIGANIGVFTLNVLLRAKNNGVPVEIYAVEPEPNNLAILKMNLSNNSWLIGDSKVYIVENGILDRSGRAFINDKHGSSHLADEGSEINILSFDDLFDMEKIDKVSFAKLDIEGSEIPALLSVSDSNLDKIRRIAVEFDEHNGLDNFAALINRFARNCQINTLGVPARGCYIYAERFDV